MLIISFNSLRQSCEIIKMEMQIIHQFNLVLNLIKEIPFFDGTDKNQLPDFIMQVEAIIPSMSPFEVNNRSILFGYLKNKCTGMTREVLHRHGNITGWEELKRVLLDNFGEKETSVELMDKLKTWSMNSTIEKYHFDINNIRNKLHNRCLTHGEEGFSTQEINRISLEVFKNHLPEPTKTMIFARNPETLEAAYRIILEARHQNYNYLGMNRLGDNNKGPSFRTNFSDNFRNRNNYGNQSQGTRVNHNTFRNRIHSDSRQYGNYSNNNSRNNQQPKYQNSGHSRRQSTQTRNSYNLNSNSEQPMDVGNANVNFIQNAQNGFPI